MGYHLEIIWVAEPGGSLDAGRRGGSDAANLMARTSCVTLNITATIVK